MRARSGTRRSASSAALRGAGAAIGVLLGGILTEYVGWEWIFFVNVPIAAATLFFVPRLVQESRAADLARHFDARAR